MSKPAIDELLDTVSEGNQEHPIFGNRWAGERDEEGFLLDVDEYVLNLQQDKRDLCKVLEELIDATTNVRGIDDDMEDIYCPRQYSAARTALAKARGEYYER